jgi:hypothetical protein
MRLLLERPGPPPCGKTDLRLVSRRAREAGGDRPDTLNAMACYHYGRGDMVEAKKLFDMVMKPSPPSSPERARRRSAPPASLRPPRH